MANKINAVKKIRSLFKDLNKPMTLYEIKHEIPDLKASDVSMALCYFMKKKQVTRKLIPNDNGRARKEIYQYTYDDSGVNNDQS